MLDLRKFEKRHKELAKPEEYGSLYVKIDDKKHKLFTFRSGNGYDGVDLLRFQDNIKNALKELNGESEKAQAVVMANAITKMFKDKFPFSEFKDRMRDLDPSFVVTDSEYQKQVYDALFEINETDATDFGNIVVKLYAKISKIQNINIHEKK